MSSTMEDFDHLKIQMEDIKSATNNFSRDTRIGGGGFGPVYKGKLSLPTGPTMVAFKRLDSRSDQGNPEFWKEIMLLSKYKHENLISLLNFCIEGAERVLVYEYAPRGSLDRYLGDASLTWNQRLHICIGAARALNYLHHPTETQQRVLHRDIKSSNILLDENWSAKVSDFGLSRIGPANQLQTYLVSNPVGTPGYCDPLYSEMGFLTKESDVYSFGVVLFEVMCGRLCYEYSKGALNRILVHEWKTCYDENKLEDIIFQNIKGEIVWDSLITFSSIARRCLNRDRKDRPTMHEVVNALEDALERQENTFCDIDFFKISKSAVPPLPYMTRKELISILFKGILVDEGKKWIWMNENKQINEMISATQCFHGENLLSFSRRSSSRFSNVIYSEKYSSFEVSVNTQFLSPDTTYTLNLFMNVGYMLEYYRLPITLEISIPEICIPFQYKSDEDIDYQDALLSPDRENGWGVVQLYQFANNKKTYKFTFKFTEFTNDYNIEGYYFEGIEFRPM